jgi:hypothetical protein
MVNKQETMKDIDLTIEKMEKYPKTYFYDIKILKRVKLFLKQELKENKCKK